LNVVRHGVIARADVIRAVFQHSLNVTRILERPSDEPGEIASDDVLLDLEDFISTQVLHLNAMGRELVLVVRNLGMKRLVVLHTLVVHKHREGVNLSAGPDILLAQGFESCFRGKSRLESVVDRLPLVLRVVAENLLNLGQVVP